MTCTFYHAESNRCRNSYCYYELFNDPTCPTKKEYMAEIGPVDPTYRAKVREAEQRDAERERAKAVIWGKR